VWRSPRRWRRRLQWCRVARQVLNLDLVCRLERVRSSLRLAFLVPCLGPALELDLHLLGLLLMGLVGQPGLLLLDRGQLDRGQWGRGQLRLVRSQ